MTMNKLSVNIVTGNSTLTPLSAEEIAEREAYERDVQPGIDLQELREERNRRLAETDWQIVKHKELGTNIPAALKTYRQELRDLPANTSDPANPTWPVKPS
tara:strand:+ start:2916 stop:3218 length:303 start_codon:yes stop_codon:yes gene_type:complete